MVDNAAGKTHTQPLTLQVSDLTKNYGDVEVLKSVCIDMEAGDFLVLVGPSGCGKSTLLNCIAGLEEATGGKVFISGRDVTLVPPRDRDIAMVFQSYALYPTMTVSENIGFGMKVRKTPRNEQDAKVLEVARILQIEALLTRKPGQLSGGQRQRVAMGRALVRDPKLFLFDEPLSNLDAKLRVEMRGEIKALHQRLDASIVYVTHDQIEAMTLGTRIVVLKDGQVQQVGTPSEIYDHPANLFVADFMGSPPMNLVNARLRADGEEVLVEFGQGKKAPVLELTNASKALKSRAGAKITVGIRPEALTLADGGKADFSLEVKKLEHAGSDIFVTFELGGKPLTARLGGRTKIAAGERVDLSVEKDAICFFDPETEQLIG